MHILTFTRSLHQGPMATGYRTETCSCLIIHNSIIRTYNKICVQMDCALYRMIVKAQQDGNHQSITHYLLTPWCRVLANWFAASQEITRISRNPKVHYRTHKRPLPVSILGQPNPVHIPTSHLLEIRPNTIHPSTPRSPQWSLSLQV